MVSDLEKGFISKAMVNMLEGEGVVYDNTPPYLTTGRHLIESLGSVAMGVFKRG